MAAASIVLRACPAGLPLTLRIDSMATIGAITKGPVSERKRIRAAGRAWLNLCREDFQEKGTHISVEHISSHKGLITPEQRNDNADRIANEFRELGDTQPPVQYLTVSEEVFFLKHGSTHIQSDPRIFLKKLEEGQLLEEWSTRAPKQAEWYLKYPCQFRAQAKRVWKWAAEKGNGRLWVYFILASCQWLPTNYRLNAHANAEKTRYCLCLLEATEDMEHILICPALLVEQNRFNKEVIECLHETSTSM